jgi:hypothetical protein
MRVSLTRMRVKMALTSVISTRSSVIPTVELYTHSGICTRSVISSRTKDWFLHAK